MRKKNVYKKKSGCVRDLFENKALEAMKNYQPPLETIESLKYQRKNIKKRGEARLNKKLPSFFACVFALLFHITYALEKNGLNGQLLATGAG